MNELDFCQQLTTLLGRMGDLPDDDRQRLSTLVDDTRSRHDRMRRAIAELQESLDYLRLGVKYLVFDLEATRRENQYLRALLDRMGGAGDRREQE